MKKVYICGPMTGLPDHNYPAFHAAEAKLLEDGYEVVSPARLDHSENKKWSDYMRTSIRAMLDCDTICVLPGTSASKGGTLERWIASALGFDVIKL